MTIGERIYFCRLERKMTQKQLAEKAGMADSAIRKYESGRITPKFETLNRIAAALEVPWTTLYPNNEKAAEAYSSTYNDFTDEATEPELIGEQAADSLNTMQSRIHSEQILKDFAALNEKGREEAAKRVHELTFLPEYKKDLTQK
ncbi:MAG: helix-turn-helix domain-containing protein [Faecalibacterium prausnitzii]|nr:helix-turn-helix domain-containing protein [Faecalibacterium prausnitzii]